MVDDHLSQNSIAKKTLLIFTALQKNVVSFLAMKKKQKNTEVKMDEKLLLIGIIDTDFRCVFTHELKGLIGSFKSRT